MSTEYWYVSLDYLERNGISTEGGSSGIQYRFRCPLCSSDASIPLGAETKKFGRCFSCDATLGIHQHQRDRDITYLATLVPRRAHTAHHARSGDIVDGTYVVQTRPVGDAAKQYLTSRGILWDEYSHVFACFGIQETCYAQHVYLCWHNILGHYELRLAGPTLPGVEPKRNPPGHTKTLTRVDLSHDTESLTTYYVFEGMLSALSYLQMHHIAEGVGCIILNSVSTRQQFLAYTAVLDAERYILCLDNDDPGIRATNEIAEALAPSSQVEIDLPPMAGDWNDALVARSTALEPVPQPLPLTLPAGRPRQPHADYLTAEDFAEYVALSRQLQKIVVVTDRCGSGKSYARNLYVAEHYEDAPRLVVERISTSREIAHHLQALGVPEAHIGLYNSHETTALLAELYTDVERRTRPVAIMTHARLQLDSTHAWVRTTSDVVPQSRTIIIDEIPQSLVRAVCIEQDVFLVRSQSLHPELLHAVSQAMEHHHRYTPRQALKMLMDAEPQLRAYLHYMIEARRPLSVTGILPTPTITGGQGLQRLESRYLTGRRPSAQDTALGVERIAYHMNLVYFAVLTGRFAVDARGTMTCVISSPLFAWNAEHGIATLILDATADCTKYPSDLCVIAPAKFPRMPKKYTLHKVVGFAPSKLAYSRETQRRMDALYETLFLRLTTLIEHIYQPGDTLYCCTWKDQAEAQEHMEILATETDVSKVTIDGVDHYAWRDPLRSSQLCRVWTRSATPRPGRKFHVNELNMESLLYTICQHLHLYTNLDKTAALHTRQLDPSTPDYVTYSLALEAKIQVYITHFGMTRSDNRYAACNKVLIFGDFWQPQALYQDHALFLHQQALTEEEKHQIISGYLEQEICRSQIRMGKEIEVYCIAADEILYHMTTRLEPAAVDELQIDAGDIDVPADMYEELAKLTQSQRHKVIQVLAAYPALAQHQKITLTTVEFAQITGMRSCDVLDQLENIVKRSKFHYAVLEATKRSSASLFEFWIP